jgi:hypothetical protein
MTWLRISGAFGRALFVQISLCLAMGVVAADALQAVQSEGNTTVALKLSSGGEVRVTLKQEKAGDSYPYKDALLWGGDVGEPPRFLLTSIRILNGSDTIFLPLSAYGDLGDVKLASVDRTTHGFTLSLHGGEASAAYDATLSFSQGYLVSRIVALREFPDQRRERASYSFPRRSPE